MFKMVRQFGSLVDKFVLVITGHSSLSYNIRNHANTEEQTDRNNKKQKYELATLNYLPQFCQPHDKSRDKKGKPTQAHEVDRNDTGNGTLDGV